MRKRIWRMSEDKFDNRRPKLTFSEEHILLTGVEGKKLSGEFSIASPEDYPIRGIVYCSNPYIRILNPQFDGTDVTIRFEVKGQNYKEGDQLQGYFTIVYNGGEHRLPFDVHFEREKLFCSTGEITSLADFVELAKGHWNEAMNLFYSDAFARFMRDKSIQERLLYAGYRRAVPSAANLEEFMVSTGLKNPVTFSVKEREEQFYRVTENRKESLLISKSSWGFIEIDIESDNDFVTVENDKITSDFFLGSTMVLNYYIHKNRMHNGKNYARITFSCKGTIYEVTIMATFDERDEEKVWNHRQMKHEQVLLTKTYEEYRFRRITTGEWCERSIAILEDMLRMEPENHWFMLMKVHCFVVNKQRQEALWIIQDLKKEIPDKSSVEWAYLLYLCTLIEQEESYVNRLTKEIEMIFRHHEEDPRVFWFLSFLREEYVTNHTRKLSDIKTWIQAGHPSPFLFIEAYTLMLQDPYMIYEFSDITVQILYWATRRGLLTRDIALQICHTMSKSNEFTEKNWYLIQKAYEIYPDREFLIEIISYLLRTQRYEERFLPWYDKGIAEDVRLNGLYEAYMLSLPESSTDPLPHVLVLYFRYSCNLPYQKKALLFANIILNRKNAPQLYEQYLRSMELFAIEQMKLNRMDDNLAIVYQNILEMGVVDEDMANAVAGMVFMKKLVCIYPDIARVFVYQEQYEMPIVVPVMNGVCYVPLVSEHFQIFMETKWGTLITDTKGYTLQRIMFEEAYLERLKNLAPAALTFVLADFDKKKSPEDFTLDDINKIETFLHTSLVSKSYKKQKYGTIIAFLRSHFREELLEEYFSAEVDEQDLDEDSRSFMLSLQLEKGQYATVYSMLKKYNGLQVDSALLLQMCNELIISSNFERDEFLIDLCSYLSGQNQYTAATIVYLASNAVGPTKWMLQLWHQAKEEELHVLDLEENILFQSLYAESHLEEVMPIFESYMTRGKDKMLIEAFINYWSHAYMLSKEDVPEQLFTYLAYYFDREVSLKESCNLAYMKFLSTVPLLSEREYKILDCLLQRYILRNVYFAFYKKMDQRLIVKYHLYDKYFVEYRGNGGDHLTISYQLNDGEVVEEDMVEIYEGIFVKQFVLFFGESVKYELYEDSISDLPVCADTLVVSSSIQEGKCDRYDLLNRMQSELVFDDQDALARDMKLYQGLDQVTKTLFTTI